MEGETGGKGAIGFKGTEGCVGDPGLTGVKVIVVIFCLLFNSEKKSSTSRPAEKKILND